jgi:chromosome segregation ATPase
VCNQLAQRTVLYSAHERRWHHTLRMNEGVTGNLTDEVTQLRSKANILESQYLVVDKERLNALMEVKELKEELSKCHNELNQTNENLSIFGAELDEYKAQNEMLQSMVNRLKRSDMDAFEKDMTISTETMRKEFRIKEDILKRQQEELRTKLLNEVAKKEQLISSLNDLQLELEDKNTLINQLHQQVQEIGHINDITSIKLTGSVDETPVYQYHNEDESPSILDLDNVDYEFTDNLHEKAAVSSSHNYAVITNNSSGDGVVMYSERRDHELLSHSQDEHYQSILVSNSSEVIVF